MQPRIPNCRSSHSKCLGEKKYKPLQFETFNVSERKPSESGLTSLLTVVDLGDIDEDWFNKKQQRQVTEVADRCEEYDKLDGKIAATTPHHATQSKDHQPSPSLFSPEESSSVAKNKRRRIGGTIPVWAGFPGNMGAYDSPASVTAFTPNQATGRALDPSQASQQQSQASTTGFSPFPSWNPTNKVATPAFMKQLFKTPSSIVRTPGRKITTPDSFISVSTSQRLSISLGADLDDSNLSWTSSLATPPGSKSDNKMGSSDGMQSEAEMRIGVMPKALHFSQADIKTAAVDKGCDAHSQSLDNDTQPLQLLRLSSLEDDGTSEDTLDSDAIGDKEDDGDVVMGIPSVVKQSVESNKNDKPSTNSEKASINKDEKTSLSDSSVLMKDASNIQDVHHRPSSRQDKPKVQEDDVGSDISESKDVSKESPTAKDNNSVSARSKENQKTSKDEINPKLEKKTTPEDVCGEGAKAGNITSSQSNIEETIAFFLATPPQRRAKLSKLAVESGQVNSETMTKVNGVARKDTTAEIKDLPKDNQTGLAETNSTAGCKSSTIVGNEEVVEEMEDVIENDMRTATKQASGIDVSKNGLVSDGNALHLVETDSKTTVEPINEVVSKEPVQPNRLDQQDTPQRLDVSAASVNLNTTHNAIDVTPMSHTDNQDLFSQISPNYADALCRAVDALADNHEMSGRNSSLITTSPRPQVSSQSSKSEVPSQPSSSVLVSSGIGATCINEPTGQVIVKQEHEESKQITLDSEHPRCTSEDQSRGVASVPQQVTSSALTATTCPSADQSVEETATAIFRMKPKTTKKFYYPSANSSPIPDVSKVDQHSSTPKLMAGTLHVVEEEGGNVESDTEGGQMNASTSETSSSTPASRNSSGFVTFSSFMKTIEKDPKSTSNHTPKSSGSMLSHQQHPSASKVTPGMDRDRNQPAQLKENISPMAAAGQNQVGNRSTPVRGRRTGVLSRKSRRRLGHSSLPPPKRLKTMAEQEDFHQNLDSIDKDVDDEVQIVSVKEMPPPVSSSDQLAASLTSGFKSAANKTISITRTSMEKASDMMAEINKQEGEQLQARSATLSAGRIVSGFQTAGKKAIGISSGSLQKAKGMMMEIYSQDIQLPSDVDNKVTNHAGRQSLVSGFQTAGKKPINISSGSLQKAKGMMAEIYSQDIQLPSSTDSSKASNRTIGQSLVSGFQTAGKKPINILPGSLQKAKGMMAEIYSQDIQLPSELPSDSAQTTTQHCSDGSSKPTKEAGVSSAHPVSSWKDEANCPQQVGFSSASSKAIKISASSMMKARRLVDEVEKEFDSSKKPDLKKRDSGNVSSTSMDRETNETLQESHFPEESTSIVRSEGSSRTSFHNLEKKVMVGPSKSIPSAVGFMSASGKSISISAKAMKTAQSFMASVESDPVQESKSFSSNLVAGQSQELPFVGFKSASGKSINISEDALKKAEMLVRDAQQMEDESLHATGSGKLPVNNSAGFNNGSAAPFAVGFSSASGKALSVSSSALQKAKSLMDEVNQTISDSTPGEKIGTSDHSFTSNDDSGINTSGSTLPTFNSSSKEILDIGMEKSPILLSGPTTATGGLRQRQHPLQMAPQGGKPKKDYSKLPKGFRPFKPPSRVAPSHKTLPTRRQSGRLSKAATIKTEPRMDLNGNKSNSQTVIESPCAVSNSKNADRNITAPTCEVMASRPTPSTNMPNTEPHDGFSDDDGLSPSQAQREIQAAEHTELMYAFMKAEEETFVEDPDQDQQHPVRLDTSVNAAGTKGVQKQVPDVKEQVPSLKVDAKLLDDSLIREEDLHLIAKVEAHHTNTLGKPEIVMNNSVVSSQASQLDGSLNQGFVNSQVTVSSQVNEAENGLCDRDGHDVGTLKGSMVVSEDVRLVLAELQTMKQQLKKRNNESDIQLDGRMRKSKMTPAASSQGAKETSMNVVGAVGKPPEFAGFRTGSGRRVSVSAAALEKAKSMIASDEADELNLPSSSSRSETLQMSSRMCDASASNGLHHQTFQQISHDCSEHNQIAQDSNDIGLSSNSKFPVGFCITSGTKVQVSDASLQRAKEVLNENRTDTNESTSRQDCVNNDQAFPLAVGLKTASGRTVSQQSLQKANVFLHENGNHSDDFPMQSGLTLETSSTTAGFQTAGGKKVHISEKALEKAQQMLQEDVEHSDTNCVPQRSGFSGFQTAGGKKVHISKKAMEKAQQMLKEEDGGRNGVSQASGFSGFQTAGGKKVHISEKALKKAQQMLKEDEEHSDTNCVPQSSDFSGFQTAGGKKVHISEKALKKAQQMLKEDEEHSDTNCVPQSSGFSGFQTAGGKKVHISEKALEKAQQALQEDDNAGRNVPQGSGFAGFQTAGGKQVHISDQALENARQMLSEDQANNDDRSLISQSKGFVGFQTASGSKVNISEVAIKNAQKFLNQDNENPIPTPQPSSSCTGFAGFTTACGNEVKISQDAIMKAQMFLNQDNVNSIPTPQPSRPSTGFAGFQTASGSKVNISDDAIKKAQTFLNQDNENSIPLPQPTRPTAGFICFSTASGNKVDVSEESLKIAKNLIAGDSGGSTRTLPHSSSNGNFVGFTTASGSKVQVSEQSLQMAKNLLSDEMGQSGGECPSAVPQVPPSTSFVGFKSASGTNVEVAEESLRIARNLITSESPQNDNPNCSRVETEMPTRNTGFAGFTTASGSRVEVSEESLKLAKNLITEEDDSIKTPYGIVPQGSRQGTSHKSQGAGINRVNGSMHHHGAVSGEESVVPQKMKTRLDQDRMVGERTAEGASRKQFIPFRRQQQPVSSSPAGQWADRSSNAVGQRSKSFKPYCTTPVTSNSCSTNNKQVLPKSIANQTIRNITKVQSEQVQVVPQQLLQSNQWAPKSVPFYKKPNFQPGRGVAQAQKSFQKFVPVPPGKTTNSTISDSSSSTQSSTGSGQIGLDMKQVWQQARLKQKARIEAKKTQRIKPCPGSLFSKRQHMPRIKLYDVVDGQAPQEYSQQQLFSEGLLPSTLQVNAAKAESFQFKGAEHFSQVAMTTEDGILLGDGGRLVLDDTGMAGKEQFYHALLDTNGVDPKLVSEEWVANHYRWIVWKLAAMEVAYPQQFAARLLTPHWVMLQLKYRYDREIDNSQRSSLKKILERDDAPSRRLVLCVSGICKTGSETTQAESEKGGGGIGKNDSQKPAPLTRLELTDGWYCIKTTIDKALLNLVQKGQIFVGQKLCIYGAELVGSDDACSPLEVPANLMLRINANSTRPARYDAKLGLQSNPQPYPVTLSSLYGEGGVAGCLDVVVVRCYPIQYMEKHEEGGATFRNNRAEEKEARKYNREKQQRMEKLFTKIQKEFEKKQAKKEPRRKTRSRSSQHLKEDQIRELCTGQEIYEALNDAYDPGAIEMHLSEKQMMSLHNYQRSLQEKEQADLQAEFRKALEEQEEESKDRVVTPLLRVRLTDYHHTSKTIDPLSQTCQMTVWRPTEDIMTFLTEGKRLKIYNVNVSAGRFSQNSNSVQLASTKRTRYKELPAESGQLSDVYQARTPAPIWYLRQSGYEALYGEIDVVGLVTSISSGSSGRKSGSNMQTVCVADSDANVITVKFWGGLQAYSVEDIIKVGSYICCSNLQYKGRDRYNAVPYLQATDVSSFTQTPKSDGMRQALALLKQNIKNPQEFINYVQSMVYSSATTPQPVKTTTVPTRQPRMATPFVASTSASRHHPTNTETGQPMKTPTMPTRQPRVASPFMASTSISNASKHYPTNVEQKNTDSQCDPSSIGPKVTPPAGSAPLKPNSSINKVTDSAPPVKRFVPYTGVKNNQTPSNSKTFTPAPSRGVQNYPVTSQYSSVNKGSTSTPMVGPSHAYPHRVPTTPVGLYQSITGKLGNQARSNLFGSASGINASNTPLKGAASGFDGSFHSEEGSASQSSQLEEKRKDVDRRTRLLGRIPSPAALSPLPSPLSGAVRRGFRLPNRSHKDTSNSADKHNIPERGSHLKSKVEDGESEQVKIDHAYDSRPVSSLANSKQCDGLMTEQNEKVLTDGLTSSQREVQEVMGMSLSCLQELDQEWSQQTPVKSILNTTSHDADSPPIDLSYPEQEEPLMVQEQMKRVKETANVHPPDAKVAHTSGQSDYSDNKVNQVSSDKDPMTSNSEINLPKPELSQESTSTQISQESTSTQMSQDSTQSDATGVKKKRTVTGRGRRRAGKRPAKDSPSTQEKPAQSKRFCTRADYAVIDFESLEGADGVSTRRVTRSSKRLQRS